MMAISSPTRFKTALMATCILILTGCLPSNEQAVGAVAKELCSCLFVVERSDQQCRDDIWFATALVNSIKINQTEKWVEAKAGVFEPQSAKFQYFDSRYGCLYKLQPN